ncbi:TetR/AcrR family transcriptional regulator [Candidatus Sodalis pierantonius]|uniref:TetR/AcrR family transcriptional regulator n=1 Tax=Candidatus Sodalis pierantonii TaxID=1486991 RepID=UPI001F2A1015|nr:TetR/AcrR family transcriptional regulator [Candidatus Sodalis pierantonius]
MAAADPDTRQALILAGIAMLTEQGFTASGIDGILKAAGVPKGSFYYYFPSKAAFGQAIVAGYGDYFAARLARCLTQSDLTPLARLQVFIEQSAAGMAKYDFRRGCLVGNLGQEIAVLPAGYRQQLSAILHGWQRQVADCLRLAQAAGAGSGHIRSLIPISPDH